MVRDAYFALASTKLIGTLDQINGFTAKNQYPGAERALPSEYGAISNLRFLLSSIGSVTPNASNQGNDVYNIFCVGMESYGVVQQNGYSAQFIYLPPQFSGPLAQNITVGWKTAFVPRITNDLWVINLRCTLAS